jgi:hypothetical protein
MRKHWVILSLAVIGCAAFADTTDTRSKLSGTWQAQGGSAQKWVIEENGDLIRISHSTGGEKAAEVECNTVGRECEWNHDGKKGTVSMYFNGPKLVQLETRGSEVVKRRFKVTPDGNTLEVEIIPVVPAGSSQTIRFDRAAEQAPAR